MADGLQTFSTSEVPSATKLNKVAKHTVIDCTSGTHPSSPVEGTMIRETDTDLLKTYDGTVYRSYPQGVLAWDNLVFTGFNTSLSVISGSGTTFDAVEDELYEYRIDLVCVAAANNVTINVQPQLNDGGGYADTDKLRSVYCDDLGVGYNLSLSIVWQATVTGSCTFRVKAATVASTGSITADTTCRVSHCGSWWV